MESVRKADGWPVRIRSYEMIEIIDYTDCASKCTQCRRPSTFIDTIQSLFLK